MELVSINSSTGSSAGTSVTCGRSCSSRGPVPSARPKLSTSYPSPPAALLHHLTHQFPPCRHHLGRKWGFLALTFTTSPVLWHNCLITIMAPAGFVTPLNGFCDFQGPILPVSGYFSASNKSILSRRIFSDDIIWNPLHRSFPLSASGSFTLASSS